MKKENLKDVEYVTKLSAFGTMMMGMIFLGPLSILLLLAVIFSFLASDFWVVFLMSSFMLPFFLQLIFILKGSISVLIFNKKYTTSEFSEIISLSSLKHKKKKRTGITVEGIVDGKEKQKLDQDGDGEILVSEFYPLTEKEVLEKIISVDENFSKTEFYTFVQGIFMLIQEAWSENNYHKLRAFEADSLYYRHKIQIEELIKNKLIDKRSNVKIKGVLLKDFKVEGKKEFVVVALTANMLRGYSYETEDYPYIMMFSRNKGVKTKTDSKLSTTNCCNCGAVIDVSDDGVCNYCNTSLVSGELEWVLVDMKQIDLIKG